MAGTRPEKVAYLSIHAVHPGQEMMELVRWENSHLVPVAATAGAEVVVIFRNLRLAGLRHILSLRLGGHRHEGPRWSLGRLVAQLGAQTRLVAGSAVRL